MKTKCKICEGELITKKGDEAICFFCAFKVWNEVNRLLGINVKKKISIKDIKFK